MDFISLLVGKYSDQERSLLVDNFMGKFSFAKIFPG